MALTEDELGRLEELLRRRAELDERLARFKSEFAVLFADISGSTSFYDRRGDVSGIVMVQQFMDHARGAVEQCGGRVVKTMGDAVLVQFQEAREALRGAVALHQAFAEFNQARSPADRIGVRIGLSWGAGFLKDNDVFGGVVNTAARLEEVAEPGQILLSGAFQDAVRELPGANLVRVGEEKLRGKGGLQEVYQLVWPGAARALGPEYSVVLVGPGAETMEFRLERSETVLGKTRGEIGFPADSLLSAAHARFVMDEGGLRVEDMSQGGVFLRVAQPVPLQAGDVILVGRMLVDFVLGHKPGQAWLRHEGKSYELKEPRTVIGRREGDMVFPEESFLSSRHARIRNEDGVYYLEDLRSTNGTYVRVRGSARLSSGDEILCGGQLLRVRQR